LFQPDDPLAPRDRVFDHAWQAQVLSIADGLVRAGHVTATDWAAALGAALHLAEAAGLPDTTETYYTAALAALESLLARVGIPASEQAARKAAWEEAYRRTPHGRPVLL
jgi:nitrile hydratase accessory protein